MTMRLPNERLAAIFLDRDGTIMEDVNYCAKASDVRVFPDASAALRYLKAAGYKLVVITNQSGIGRGYFSEADYHQVAREMERQLGEGVIDATYFCPDRPDENSPRRKPAPAMIFEAQREHALDLARSFFIGDKAIDAECGRAAGMRTILVGNADGNADWHARDLAEAVEIILRHGV
ncbi:MAG: HAD family hydrolase [Verrucomicrobiota bacterium]|nr:HAD family hydrolase [Verrucomicrobiota bacterium]